MVKKDGGYSSSNYFDEDTLALLTANDAGSEGQPE
jgi:hypothetical protein